MYCESFPMCCALNILCGFSLGDYTPLMEQNFKTAALDQIERTRRSSYSMLVATVNTKQTGALKALKELGFKSSRWAPRPNKNHVHADTKVKLLYYYIK